MSKKLDVPSLWCDDMQHVIDKQTALSADLYEAGQSLEDMRESYRKERTYWNDYGPEVFSIDNRKIATTFGDVKVRMYRPNNQKILPAIVYMHGGGLVLGDLDTHDRITRKLSAATDAAVIAIEYTLSPEAHFPQAIEECVQVTQHLQENALEWGIDPMDISFSGDSGGAHLGLATYLWLRNKENNVSGVRCMMLFYGMYGLRDSMSLRTLGGSWDGLSEADFEFYMSMYLGEEKDYLAKYFNLLDQDFTFSMVPTHILGLALDPLRDDSRTLAALLEASGVEVDFSEIDEVIHGFLHHARLLPQTDQALEAAASFYRSLA